MLLLVIVYIRLVNLFRGIHTEYVSCNLDYLTNSKQTSSISMFIIEFYIL